MFVSYLQGGLELGDLLVVLVFSDKGARRYGSGLGFCPVGLESWHVGLAGDEVSLFRLPLPYCQKKT